MIPKRIIQTDKSPDLPPLLRACVSSMKLHNPGFEYVFFDDRQVEEFVDSQFPEYRQVFNSFSLPIQRYDFFRYLAVYRLGGFYFDTDMLLASSLTELLELDCVFPFERLTWSDYLRDEYGMHWEVGNYAFGASAGHPFLLAVIKNCVRAQQDGEWRKLSTSSLPRLLQSELAVIYSTGPGLVSRTLGAYEGTTQPVDVLFQDDICDKRRCWNLFGKYGVHLGGGSWRAKHGPLKRRLLNFLGNRNEARSMKLARNRNPDSNLGDGRPVIGDSRAVRITTP